MTNIEINYNPNLSVDNIQQIIGKQFPYRIKKVSQYSPRADIMQFIVKKSDFTGAGIGIKHKKNKSIIIVNGIIPEIWARIVLFLVIPLILLAFFEFLGPPRALKEEIVSFIENCPELKLYNYPEDKLGNYPIINKSSLNNSFEESQMLCIECNEAIESWRKYCLNCGAKLSNLTIKLEPIFNEQDPEDNYGNSDENLEPIPIPPKIIKGISPAEWIELKDKGLTREQALEFLKSGRPLIEAKIWLQEQ